MSEGKWDEKSEVVGEVASGLGGTPASRAAAAAGATAVVSCLPAAPVVVPAMVGVYLLGKAWDWLTD